MNSHTAGKLAQILFHVYRDLCRSLMNLLQSFLMAWPSGNVCAVTQMRVKLGVKQLYVVQKETAKLIAGVRHFTPRPDHL
jgi:hypothetical protein